MELCPHTYPPHLQPKGEPFLGRKEGGGQHIRRQQNQALSWGRGGGREIQVPEVRESPRLWDLGVL